MKNFHKKSKFNIFTHFYPARIVVNWKKKMVFSLRWVWIVIFILASHPAWGALIKIPADYQTIQEGIDAAKAGDTVLVAAGRYNEQIVMKEGVVLKSDSSNNGDKLVEGPGQKKVLQRAIRTIIDGSGYPSHTQARPMVEFPAGITKATILDGFTITNMPEVDHTLPGHAHTVQCRGSSPVVRNNIVINNGSSGIGSHAQFKTGSPPPEGKFSFQNIAFDAATLIENNVFAKNVGAGIGNNHYSYATVRNNESFGNISKHNHSAPGIGIQHGAHPLVEGNLVYNNDWTGIACRKGKQAVNRKTRPVIRNNTVFNNGLAGVKEHGAGIGVDAGGSAEEPILIENNVVYNNLVAGIGIREGAFVTVSGNTSYENGMAGITINKSTVQVKDNKVYNNKMAGIGCRKGQAAIINNEVYGNQMAGIGLEEAKKTVISGNRIHHNGTLSLLTKIKNFLASKFDFKVSFQGGTGVGMKKSEVSIFSHNIINNNTMPGLVIKEGSSIEKGEKNILKENGSSGAPNLVLLDQSRAVLSETTILKGETANVYISHSYLTLNNCQVEEAQKPGIIAKESSFLKINKGSVSNNGALGIQLKGSQGNFKGISISGNEHHGIDAKEKSSITVEHCNIQKNSDHGGAGISIKESEARLISNLIHHNKAAGVKADDGTLVLWHNVLADQEQGADVGGKSILDARNNIFANNKAEGLDLDKSVQIKHLSHNAFWNNGGLADRRPKILNFLPLPRKEEKEGQLDTMGNLNVDPGFVDSAKGKYQLRPNSPLIEAGEDVGLPYKSKIPAIGVIEF